MYKLTFLISFLILVFFNSNKLIAQDTTAVKTFLGFGWVIAVANDLVFVPADRVNKIPSAYDYFKQKNKNGLRVEWVNDAIEAIQYSKSFDIVSRKGEKSVIEITPVIATYKMVESNDYYQMDRIYYYKNQLDTVTYKFGLNFNLDLTIIR